VAARRYQGPPQVGFVMADGLDGHPTRGICRGKFFCGMTPQPPGGHGGSQKRRLRRAIMVWKEKLRVAETGKRRSITDYSRGVKKKTASSGAFKSDRGSVFLSKGVNSAAQGGFLGGRVTTAENLTDGENRGALHGR